MNAVPTHTRIAADNDDAIAPDHLRMAAILVISLDEQLAAQLLARLDRASVEAVTLEMARLDRVDPEEQRAVLDAFVSQGLKRLRFQFEDLVRLDDDALRAAYHDEDADTWALALAGSAGPVQAKMLAALPPPTADALRSLLACFGPFRLADAEAAQAELAERFRQLHDHGRLTFPEPEEYDDFLI